MIRVIVIVLTLVYFAAPKNQVVKNQFIPHMNLRKHMRTRWWDHSHSEWPLVRFKALTAVLLKAHLFWVFAFAGLLNIYHSTRRNDPEHVNLQIVHNLKCGRLH
jgi:hypothetical protein